MNLAHEGPGTRDTVNVGDYDDLWRGKGCDKVPPIGPMVVAQVRDGRARSADAASHGVTRDGWKFGKKTTRNVVDKSFVPHSNIKSFDRIRNRAGIGAAKQIQDL